MILPGVACENRLKILFITTVDLSLHGGGTVYSRSIFSCLGKVGEVFVVELSEVRRYRSRLLRQAISIFQSIITLSPPNVLLHSGGVSKAADILIRANWDLVVVDHLESGAALPACNAPMVYVSHNRESMLISQKMPVAPRFMRRILSRWVERYERALASKVDAVICISSEEANWYRTLNKRVFVIPPTFDVAPRRKLPVEHDRLRLGFLGGAQWLPNRDAVTLLVRDILPNTTRRLELVVAGGGWDIQGLSRQLADRGVDDRVQVIGLGAVEDIRTFWDAIDVFVAPIGAGAGVNVKVCEALANVCPVIALPHALRGLDGVGEELVYVAQNPDEFAMLIDTYSEIRHPASPPDKLTRQYAEQQVARLINSLWGKSSDE